MTCTIWKFPFEVTDELSLELPQGARFLSAQMQHDVPCMWFLLDPEAPKETRKFQVYGTGHPVAEAGEITHLCTFQMMGGQLVFHLFEKTTTN